MNSDSPESTGSSDKSDSQSDNTQTGIPMRRMMAIFRMTCGEDGTDADLETDSKNQDRDGNVRDISDDYAGAGSDDDAGSCCDRSTRRQVRYNLYLKVHLMKENLRI